jgi:hypothetical protein
MTEFAAFSHFLSFDLIPAVVTIDGRGSKKKATVE